jgi:hypothetical protein
VDKDAFWKILSHPDIRFIDLKKAEAIIAEAPSSLYKYCPASVEALTNFAAWEKEWGFSEDWQLNDTRDKS